MLATTNTCRVVVLWLLLWCCCCSAKDETRSRNQHVRTKSSPSTRQQRTQSLMAGKSAATAIAVASVADVSGSASTTVRRSKEAISGEISGEIKSNKDQGNGNADGVFHDYLFRRPSKIFRNLMKTGVNIVQHGMNAFEGVSSSVFRIAHENIGVKSPAADKSNNKTRKRVSSRSAVGNRGQPKPGFVRGLGRSVVNIIDTGITGMEQVTDFSLLLGNMGTHKLLAKLDGKNGNKEVMNLLIKYIASRVGMSSKGDGTHLIDDVGTISTFIANDDNVSNSISTLMGMFMDNHEVRTAMVRMAITVMESNPSTSCLLDRLPLSPSDVRTMFDVFVGSNGLMMLKTISGLVSELTTGPDTKAFLESAMGMVSMFKTDGPTEKPKSIMSSLTSFFTGGNGGDEDDDKDEPVLPKPPVVNKKKKGSNNISDGGTPASKPTAKKRIQRKPTVDMSWFDDDWGGGDGSFGAKDSNSAKVNSDAIGKPESKPTAKKRVQRVPTADMSWFDDDWGGGGDSFGAKDIKPAKVNRTKRRNFSGSGSEMVDGQKGKVKNNSQTRVTRNSAAEATSEYDSDTAKTSHSKSRASIKKDKHHKPPKRPTNSDGGFSEDDRKVVKKVKRAKNVETSSTKASPKGKNTN